MGSSEKKLPGWLKKFLTQPDISRIEASLAEAEATTMGEIVPVIVRGSNPTEFIPLLLFLLLLLLRGVSFDLQLHDNIWIAIALEFGYILLALLLAKSLSYLSFIQRIFSRLFVSYDYPLQRAKLFFYEKNIDRTKAHTGILLFVSLMERRVIVLGDHAINSRVEAHVWDTLVGHLTQAAKHGNIGDGFVTAIKLCGDILSQHFPIKPGDENELPDKLIYQE